MPPCAVPKSLWRWFVAAKNKKYFRRGIPLLVIEVIMSWEMIFFIWGLVSAWAIIVGLRGL